MKKKTNKKRNAKDFVYLWCKLYHKMIGRKYHVVWVKDAPIFRRLMSEYSRKDLVSVVRFVFSGHSATNYLRSRGYPIALLPYQINQFITKIHDKETNIPEDTLHLDVPVWDDKRVAYLYTCVKTGNLNTIIDNIKSDKTWQLLLIKLEKQYGTVPHRFKTFYRYWKAGKRVTRKAV